MASPTPSPTNELPKQAIMNSVLAHLSAEGERSHSDKNSDFPSMFWDWDMTTNQVQWQNAILGLSGEESLKVSHMPQDWGAHIHPDERDSIQKHIDECKAANKWFWMDQHHLDPALGFGSSVFCWGYFVYDHAEQPLRMIGFMIDSSFVQARVSLKSLMKQEEETLVASKPNFSLDEERYRLVLEGSKDGVWDWDIPNGMSYWNDRFYEMTGYRRDEFIPTPENFLALIHPDDKEHFLYSMTSHIKYNRKYEVEIRLKHANGNFLYIYTRGKALRDETGRAIRMSGTATDITERKQIEIELENAKTMAERANKNKSQFLANISHEFRTPLNAVIGYSEMLERGMAGELNEKQAKYIHNVAVSSRHLLNMVNDLLDLSKIESGNLRLIPQPIDLQLLISDRLSTFEKMAEDKQVSITYTINPGLDYLEADPVRLLQILMNLISNAVKFNQPNGKVQIRFFKSEDQQAMICEVKDTGIGMSEDKIPQLFREFYQIDSSYARQYEGTGLGLAVTKRLVEMHNGSIWVKSQLGVGSTFTFKIPLQFQG